MTITSAISAGNRGETLKLRAVGHGACCDPLYYFDETRMPRFGAAVVSPLIADDGIAGTRLYVWQVVDTVRASGNSVTEAAEYLDLPERQVQAVVDYYADFTDEVDQYRAQEREFERRDRERWERSQRVLG